MSDERCPATGMRHVLLVEDHPPTLAAVAALLELERPNISVVGAAHDGAHALRLADEASPDVVVLDLDLNGENGLELIPALILQYGVTVIILSSSNDPLKKRQGFAAGAKAFISKYAPCEELISAILAVPPRTRDMGGLSQGALTLLPVK